MLVVEDNGYDFATCWENCGLFEKYFGITEKQIRDIVNIDDLFETGEKMEKLFNLPLMVSYDDIEDDRDSFNADEF